MEKSEGHNSVRDSGNVAEGEWLFLWYRRMRRRWGVAKAEKIAYSGGVGGYGSLCALADIGNAAESAGTKVYAALADIGNVAALVVWPRLKRLRTAAESAGTEVYAARLWQTGL